MRKFINTTTDDLWTALRDDKVVDASVDGKKPKPYKNYRELSLGEKSLLSCKEHFLIMMIALKTGDHPAVSETAIKSFIDQSMANIFCEEYPELATKHNLTINTDHEYWKNK